MTKKSGQGGFTGRELGVRITGKHKASSRRWLQRQLNDPYVAEAKKRGYRSRAAFKLQQLDDKYHFIKPHSRIVDLGAAPGGWCQVALERMGNKPGKVVGIDILPIDPIAGADLITMDFMTVEALEILKAQLDGEADLVMSDMAASASGHAPTDHLKIIALAEAAYEFASEILIPGGSFIAKVLQGGTTETLLKRLKRDFAKVKHVKPGASRKDSAEIYVVALGFRKSS